MTDRATASGEGVRTGGNPFRVQDFAWLFFVIVLIATAPEKFYQAWIILPIIGAFQILEPRLKLFASRRGQIVSVALKLILSYLLVGWTHALGSTYYPIFLIPVVSAATQFELGGVIAVTLITCLLYFSFLMLALLYIRLDGDELEAYVKVMSFHASFFVIVAFLVYEQAKAKREEMQRTQKAAESLAEANRSLREAQASLRRSERLAALGQLTAGLAHELRNPLGTIKASAEMLEKASVKGRPEVMKEMTGYITSEVDRMNALVASFLDFARPLQIHPVRSDLRGVWDDVVREQTGLASEREVRLEVKMEEQLMFDFDRDLLRLALSNLVQNALQASAPGQRVEMSGHSREENILLVVSDQGEGIAADQLESIFNPFFTTKPQGVGLGLSLVAKVVDEHGGRIKVFSQPGAGTRFEVTLPRQLA